MGINQTRSDEGRVAVKPLDPGRPGQLTFLTLYFLVSEEERWRRDIFVQTELFVCSTFEVYSILLYSCFKVYLDFTEIQRHFKTEGFWCFLFHYKTPVLT